MEHLFDLNLQRDRLYQQVADRIQALIADESLHPGQKLPGERELAERLGVSRPVVREAVRSLAVRGLVTVKPGCGTYIRQPSLRDAAEPIGLYLKLRYGADSLAKLYEIRRMLEIEIAGLAAERATEADLAAMQAAIDSLVVDTDDAQRATQDDLTFHLALANATHNQLFGLLLEPISDMLAAAIHISYHASGAVPAGIHHHRAVLAAIRAHDPEHARQAMRNHIRESQALAEAGSHGQED
ncbi:MAG: FadR/GntR family transcriptional regulator [Anaerolineae bacterium]